ncbi:hypothetical protein X975_04349, partial [Stegodyphus mimosarum]
MHFFISALSLSRNHVTHLRISGLRTQLIIPLMSVGPTYINRTGQPNLSYPSKGGRRYFNKNSDG